VACLRNLHQNPKFDLWISEALAKLVRESLNKVIEAKKVSINSQKTSL